MKITIADFVGLMDDLVLIYCSKMQDCGALQPVKYGGTGEKRGQKADEKMPWVTGMKK